MKISAELIKNTIRKKLNYFSLIELLIVVSIILILISLIQPALTKVIRSAQNTVCQNQLKQIGYATHLYADDFNGKYMTKLYTHFTGTAHWPMGGMVDRKLKNPAGILTLYTEEYLKDPKTLYCPLIDDKDDSLNTIVWGYDTAFPLVNPRGNDMYYHNRLGQEVSKSYAINKTLIGYNSWVRYDESYEALDFKAEGVELANSPSDSGSAILVSDRILTWRWGGYVDTNNHDFGEDSLPEGGNHLLNGGSVLWKDYFDLDYTFNHTSAFNFYLYKN